MRIFKDGYHVFSRGLEDKKEISIQGIIATKGLREHRKVQG